MTLFILFRFVLTVIILFISRTIPYLGFFPYKERLEQYGLSQFLYRLGNFDGIHYIINAQEGYHTYEQAFFPLYPLLIRIVRPVLWNNTLLSGIVLSQIFLLLSCILITKILNKTNMHSEVKKWLFLFFLFSPFSFFFHTVYTESLFLFLFLLSVYVYVKDNYLIIVSSLLLSLTRFVGIFFITIPLLAIFTKKVRTKIILTIISSILGLLIYMLYLYQTTGDPIKFLTSQPAFGANRSSSIILPIQVLFRYIKIVLSLDWNYAFFIAVVELIVYLSVLLIVCIQLYRDVKNKKIMMITIDTFSTINIILPSLTGTLSSIPRYALMSFSVYFFFASLKNVWLKRMLLSASIIFNILFFSLFLQGYFVA